MQTDLQLPLERGTMPACLEREGIRRTWERKTEKSWRIRIKREEGSSEPTREHYEDRKQKGCCILPSEFHGAGKFTAELTMCWHTNCTQRRKRMNSSYTGEENIKWYSVSSSKITLPHLGPIRPKHIDYLHQSWHEKYCNGKLMNYGNSGPHCKCRVNMNFYFIMCCGLLFSLNFDVNGITASWEYSTTAWVVTCQIMKTVQSGRNRRSRPRL